MSHPVLHLNETLYGNFTGGLDLHQVSEQNQVILSVYQGGESAGQRIWSEKERMLLARNDHLLLPDLLKLFPHRGRLSVKKARERLRRKKKMAGQRMAR